MENTRTFKGIGVSTGIAIGPIMVQRDQNVIIPQCLIEPGAVDEEVGRLQESFNQSLEQLKEIQAKIADEIGVEHSYIIEAQLLMLKDEEFYGAIVNEIKQKRINAEWAVEKINRKYTRALQNIEDEYLSERRFDISDVSRRVINNLGEEIVRDIHDINEPAIILTHDLPLSDLSALEQDKILGFATVVGGRTSHVGLLARSLELPAVVGLGNILDEVETGDIAIIDGEESTIIINPTDNQLNEYRNKLNLVTQVEQQLIKNKDLPAVTVDGFTVNLFANIDLPSEVKSAIDHGAQGIGLFRSEFMFIQKPRLIKDHEAHYNLYKQLVREVSPLPATIRVLDIGSDKHIHELDGKRELNPALGLRAIRLFLRDRDAIYAQLSGMLRASTEGDLRILIPFVSGITEVYQVLEIIAEVKSDLRKKNHAFNPDTQVGLMIEIPSAALIADKLARMVDFFSVGTNDLIQYTLAIDRANEKVSYLYRPLHPAMIKLLGIIIKAGEENEIPVTVCGETAGDPLSMIVLLGMRYANLSMNAVAIPHIKNIIRSFRVKDAEEIVAEVTRMETAKEAEEFILEQMAFKFPAGYTN